MLLSIIIILAAGGIAYFHYVQGFFSATLSAILAVIAAALALSYHEPIVTGLLGGKFADVAPGMTLVVLFAAIYVLLRTLFDKFVPGNVIVPLLADKIGAGVMGLVAGVFAAGILAIAAQSLPFGPTVGMFSRYETTGEKDVRLPTAGQTVDTFVYDQMKTPEIEQARASDRQSLYLPADEILLATVQRFSDEGSLAGSRTLHSVHPDYVEELFLSNVGIQVGARRSALVLPTRQEVTVPDKGLFAVPSVPQVEAEIDTIRKRNLKPVLEPKATEMILVVRVMFDRNATDNKDSKVRFSPGSMRLVAGGQNHYPVGTLEDGRTLYSNAIDDFLVVDTEGGEKGADLVYVVPAADVLTDPKAEPQKREIKPGVFLEAKRLARIDLAGRKVAQGVAPAKNVQVLRKPDVVKAAGAKPKPQGGQPGGGGGGTDAPSEGAATAPLEFNELQPNAGLPNAVGTGVAEKTVNNFMTASATGALQDGRFTKLEVNGTEDVRRMSAGSYTANELAAPEGQKVVQVRTIPAGNDPWAWASQVGAFQLVDAADKQYAPHGAVAKVKTAQGGDRMVARYGAASPATDVPRIEGRPTDVWLVYVVPSGTQLKQVNFSGQQLAAVETLVD